MSGVVSPAAFLVSDQSARVAKPSGMPPAAETPAGKRARSDLEQTPSGESALRVARENAVSILSNFANAASSSENLANASALEELRLALRKSDDRFDALCATNASSLASFESRLSALESRPSAATAFAAPLANLAVQVHALEKKFASSTDEADSDAHVFDDGLAPGAVTVFVRNVHTPGIGPGQFGFLSPESRAALNKREAARWHSILLEAKYSGDATQLAKDHTGYCRMSAETVRIVLSSAAAFALFAKRRTDFHVNPILQRLLHERDKPLTFVTGPTTTPKSTQAKAKAKTKSTARSAAFVPHAVSSPPPRTQWWNSNNSWHQPHPLQQQQFYQPFNYQATNFQSPNNFYPSDS